jgi:chorismate mutase
MLPDEIRKSLFDIRDSIDAIDAALLEVIGPRRDFGAYMKKRFLRRSVERELEIIG